MSRNVASDTNVISKNQSSATWLNNNQIDFRHEVVYFLIVDRFHDGSADEEERKGIWDRGEKTGLLDKTWLDWGKYWGGNITGVIEKIDYLKSMGVTAVWLSPLFEQVDDMQFERAPMHGYWTKDFKRINPRFVDIEDSCSLDQCQTLKKLVEKLHDAGIKLVLDIVCNHSSPDINGSKGVVYSDGKLLADYNNDDQNFYYHYPEITDWEDEFQLIHHEMCGLATFNEKNIDYRKYIKDAVKQWIDIGVDALRIDTIKHMPLTFWQEFCSDICDHKPDLFIFGEYGFSKPWDQRAINYANHSGMSILDFGLCDGIRFAFSGQEPGGFHQIKRVLSYDRAYKRASQLVTFIDNHDMPRFLSIVNNEEHLRLAITILMTLRGVPCLFYGTEQSLHCDINGGADPYNRPMMEEWNSSHPNYILIQALANLRKVNPALSMGSFEERFITEDIYVYTRHFRDNHVLVCINKSVNTTIDIQNTGFPDGELQCAITKKTISVLNNQIHSLHLEKNKAHVFSVLGPPVSSQVIGVFELNGYETKPGETLFITGSAEELGDWDTRKAYGMEYVNENTWIAEVGFDASAGKHIRYKFMVMINGSIKVIENILPRVVQLPLKGRINIDTLWNQVN